jgi:hypothetical protein
MVVRANSSSSWYEVEEALHCIAVAPRVKVGNGGLDEGNDVDFLPQLNRAGVRLRR